MKTIKINGNTYYWRVIQYDFDDTYTLFYVDGEPRKYKKYIFFGPEESCERVEFVFKIKGNITTSLTENEDKIKLAETDYQKYLKLKKNEIIL